MATKNIGNTKAKAAPRGNPSPTPQPSPIPPRVAGNAGGGGGGLGASYTPSPAKSMATHTPLGGTGGGGTSGGGGGGGGGGGYDPGLGAGTPFAGAVGIGDEDYLAGDAQYQAQLAALMKALQDSDADFGAQKGRYETSFGEGLKGLGWTNPIDDDPNTVDVNEAAPGAWNTQDLNTASGRSLNNQTNDFASRGLLQSSLYAQSKDDLMRSLNDQLSGMQGSRTGFLDDLARQQGAFQNDNTSQQQQAKAEALARRAAGLSL